MREEGEEAHRFGGPWTTAKLDVVARYLAAYLSALKDKPDPRRPFRKAYIDAFAGTGYRSSPDEVTASNPTDSLFPEMSGDEPQSFLEGSASRALRVDPGFDHYIFIERHPRRCAQLEQLRLAHEDRRRSIEVLREDANSALQGLCSKDWRGSRAVLFLDPYGMQVDWCTLEAVASTEAMDTWILFPLGGLHRMLRRDGRLDETWARKITRFLGTDSWEREFYAPSGQRSLFDDESQVVKRGSETIRRFLVERLRTIFAGVADRPGVLRNSRGSPLFLLCFAAANPKGSKVALRIANHLLRGLA